MAHKWARGLHNSIGAKGAHWLLGLIPLITNHWLEAPLGAGGGGVVRVLGRAELPPPPPPGGATQPTELVKALPFGQFTKHGT